SPLRRVGGFSTSATGFIGRPYTLRARWKTPCIRTRALVRVAGERSTPAIQDSIIGVVIDSIGVSPNAGSSWERRIAREPAAVGQPVFGVPLWPTLALDSEDVSGRSSRRRRWHAHGGQSTPSSGHIGDTFRIPAQHDWREKCRFTGLNQSRRPDSNRGPLHY